MDVGFVCRRFCPWSFCVSMYQKGQQLSWSNLKFTFIPPCRQISQTCLLMRIKDAGVQVLLESHS